MKKGFILSMALVATCIAFSFTKEKRPPSFKQDMEDFGAVLYQKSIDYSLATNYQDSADALDAARVAAQVLLSKWDVDNEMKNAASLWPLVPDRCIYNCARNYVSCMPTETTVPPYPPSVCMSVYENCVRDCR